MSYSKGVAVSEDDELLVISETNRLCLVKYWLKGPKVGAASSAYVLSGVSYASLEHAASQLGCCLCTSHRLS
jgi:hypothetical protein